MIADAQWRAVVERDAAADGQFVYGVESTGVYCRPSCPARRPRRANVRAFPGAEGAERAGFRACLRCTPKAAGTPAALAVARACAHLDAATAPVTLAALAAVVGLSPSHLQRIFVRDRGMSPRAYQQAQRLERFRQAVRQGAPTVLEAQVVAGFGSSRGLYADPFALGMTPGDYLRGGANMDLTYTLAPTRLGLLLVAETPEGVCAVSLGEGAEALVAGLRVEFPRAQIAAGAGVTPWAAAVIAEVEGKVAAASAVPLVAVGTAFQRQVWAALRKIPRGETRTYGALAVEMGLEVRQARAVAQGCAHNRLAVVVPCHRVVPAGGGTGGYRWGVDRKAALLAAEQDRGDTSASG